MSLRKAGTIVLLLFLVSLSALAQVAGRLSGSVVDPSGAAIPNAKVELLLTGGKTAVLSTVTTADGNFDFAAVRPEIYVLTVSASGFNKYTATNVKVDAVRTTTLAAIKLEVAASTQTVEVSAASVTVETGNSEIASTIQQSEVRNLPVLDRQVTSLFYTQPGVNNNTNGNTVINGIRSQNASVTLDGVNVQDTFIRINGLDFMPNKLTIGEIQEATVATSNANPAISGNAATIAMSSPAGTNKYSGNVYWYNRNNFFGANDWFNNKDGVDRPFLNLNQFGGAFGGPVKHDKLFFFTSYETFNEHQSSPVTNTILTPDARKGILTLSDGTTKFNVLNAKQLSIDPYIKGLLDQVPTAANNNTVGDDYNTTGYAFNARSNTRRDSIMGRTDYNLSVKHVFTGTFRWNRDIVDRPDQGSFYSSVPPVSNSNHTYFFVGAWRWSPSATLTNDLRFGGNLAHAPFDISNQLPTRLISGLAFTDPTNTFMPQGRDVKTYNIQDNATWVKGKHVVTFGFQSQLVDVKPYNYAGIVPTYTIGVPSTSSLGFSSGDIPGADSTDISTANSLLYTLAGLISAGSQSFYANTKNGGYEPGKPQVADWVFNTYAGYASDNWKVNRRLTATLGLRWDYYQPVKETNGISLQPVYGTDAKSTLLSSAAQVNFQGDLYKKDLNNFAPNVGVAYDLFGDGKTALRAGYAITFANDDLLEAVRYSVGRNTGLSLGSSKNDFSATASAPPTLAAPAFTMPLAQSTVWGLTARSGQMGLIDPNLRTPYVQQWNIGIQQRVKGIVFEAAYIGNHGTKLLRQVDLNQVNINQGTFLADFKSARNNGVLSNAAGKGFNPAYNAAIPGSVPLPFFNSLPGGGSLTNATIRSYIQQNAAATLAQYYQTRATPLVPNAGFSYFPNPYALASSELMNYSNSTYNGMQLQARGTVKQVQLQVSYTWAKSLTDSNVQRSIDPMADINNPGLERARAPWDLTHSLKINYVANLPFGKGKRFLSSSNGIVDRIVSGWALSGFLTTQSGQPLSILSNRGTLTRAYSSTYTIVDPATSLVSAGEIRKHMGVYQTGNGPYWIDPATINSNRTGTNADLAAPYAGQLFYNPGAGTLGTLQRRMFDGPWYTNFNASIVKNTPITERQSLEFRASFYNALNHANFYIGDQSINSTTFGRYSGQNYSADGIGPRVIEFGLMYKF